MRLRPAVPKIPPKSPVPPGLPVYKGRSFLTHSESTLLQVLISRDFNSLRINTYKKPGGGTPTSNLKVLQLVTPVYPGRRERGAPSCHSEPRGMRAHVCHSDRREESAFSSFRRRSLPLTLRKSPHQYHSMELTVPLFSYPYELLFPQLLCFENDPF